jgi:hypothetical protein
LVYGTSKFDDLKQVKYIEVTLLSRGGFNHGKAEQQKIKVDNLSLLFGFDLKSENLNNTKVGIVLDKPDPKSTSALEYDDSGSISNNKEMSIDWYNLDNNIVYNEDNPFSINFS